MLRSLLTLVLVLFTSNAFALVLRPSNCAMLNGVAASSDQTATALNLQVYTQASFHCAWTGLTGTLNGSVKLQISSFPTAINFVDKSGATFGVTSASGTDAINVTAAPETWYQLVYTHGLIAAGTLTCYCSAKD